MLSDDAAFALTERFHARLIGVSDSVGAAAGSIYSGLGSYDARDIAEFERRLRPAVQGGKAAAVALSSGYYSTLAELGPASIPAARIGTEFDSRSPFIKQWRALKQDRGFDEALLAGRAGAEAAASDFVVSTSRQTGDAVFTDAKLKVVGWRRVLEPGACAWCQLVSTQRYRTAESADFGHRNCRCAAVPIIGEHDPGRVANREALKRLKAGEDISQPVAPPPLSADEARKARRREEAAAARAEARSLTVYSPDVIRVAKANGVTPDEVMVARERVGNVRRLIAEDAARVQADALADMEAFGIGKLRRPPRIGARTGIGRVARGGEYDFLEQLDPAEKARLSRKWYSDSRSDAPDIIREAIAAINPAKAESVDDAMATWLDLNRRNEAAGAIRRGKLPSADAYSGQIDVADLAPRMSDEGYDVARMLGADDLDAAGHLAAVEREALRREAEQYLGDALGATHGPAPYRMSFQTWEEEVRDLEFELESHAAEVTAAMRGRYAELVPEFIDEPGVSFEELYARIVSTARKAGEEVPDYARIPWD